MLQGELEIFFLLLNVTTVKITKWPKNVWNMPPPFSLTLAWFCNEVHVVCKLLKFPLYFSLIIFVKTLRNYKLSHQLRAFTSILPKAWEHIATTKNDLLKIWTPNSYRMNFARYYIIEISNNTIAKKAHKRIVKSAVDKNLKNAFLKVGTYAKRIDTTFFPGWIILYSGKVWSLYLRRKKLFLIFMTITPKKLKKQGLKSSCWLQRDMDRLNTFWVKFWV